MFSNACKRQQKMKEISGGSSSSSPLPTNNVVIDQTSQFIHRIHFSNGQKK